jgi:hypothetical protein
MKKKPTTSKKTSVVNGPAIHFGSKKRYCKPEMTACGDIRDLTLGGSFGVGESTAPSVFRNASP